MSKFYELSDKPVFSPQDAVSSSSGPTRGPASASR